MADFVKGSAPQDAEYAKGGGVLDRARDFKKTDPQGRGEFGRFLGTKDEFTGRENDVAGGPESRKTDEDWTKPKGVGQTDADDAGDCKSLKAIKPRS